MRIVFVTLHYTYVHYRNYDQINVIYFVFKQETHISPFTDSIASCFILHKFFFFLCIQIIARFKKEQEQKN